MQKVLPCLEVLGGGGASVLPVPKEAVSGKQLRTILNYLIPYISWMQPYSKQQRWKKSFSSRPDGSEKYEVSKQD